MKRLAICILLLTLALPACSLGAGASEPTSVPTEPTEPSQPSAEPTEPGAALPTRSGGGSAGRCGDDACTGPENAENCPEDCAPSTEATSAPDPTTSDGAPLYLTTMTHMEGSFTDDQNEDLFHLHVEQLRYGLSLANEYGAKFTIESEIPFAQACDTWGVNALQEVLDMGHGVGTHCDTGFQYTPASVDELAELYRERKALVDALVGPENNRGFSGGGSSIDWVLAGQQAGFAYKDGGVAMLYLSMPLENRPGPQWTDDYIRNETFHNPAPVALEDRIYPFMMRDAQDFVPDEDGVVLFSPGSIGRLDAMVEGGPEDCPQMRCPFTQEDVDLIVEQIRVVDGMRDPSRIAKVNIYVPLKLFTDEYEDAWRYFLEQMASLEAEGVITWATEGQVYDAYQARNE